MMRKVLPVRQPASALTQLSKRSFADADKSLLEKAKETVGEALKLNYLGFFLPR